MDWGRCDGMFRRRTFVAVLVLVAALLCSGGVPSARAASSADNRVVTVGYEGSYDGTVTYDQADLGTIVSHVTWDFEWTGTARQLLAPQLKIFAVNALTGTETLTQHGTTCTASFSLNPSTGAGTPVSRILNAYRDASDVSKVVIGVHSPLGVEDLISDNPSCAGNGVEGAGASNTAQQQLETPTHQFDSEMLGSQTQPFNGSWSSSDTISTSTSTFRSSVTFNGGCDPNDVSPSAGAARAAVKPGKGGKQPTVCKRRSNPKAKITDPKIKKECNGRKKAAGQPATNPLTCEQWVYLAAFEIPAAVKKRDDILKEAQNAAKWAPFHLLIPEPVGGPVAGWEGAELVAKWGEVQDEIKLDYALLAKDPPDAATSSVALPALPAPYSPPPCPSVQGHGAQRAARICARDRLLYTSSVEATEQTKSVLEAMITTANRHATAAHGGQSGPAAVQIGVTRILEIQLAGALGAEQRADLRLARDLRMVALEQILTQRLRTTDLTTPDTTVTPTLVIGIVEALASQNQLPAQNAGALEQALTALAQATTASTSRQALDTFKSDISQLKGSARLFLQAAERELASQ